MKAIIPNQFLTSSTQHSTTLAKTWMYIDLYICDVYGIHCMSGECCYATAPSHKGGYNVILFYFIHCVFLLKTSLQNAFLWGCIVTLITLIFLHHAFSNVPKNCLPGMIQSHTACICLTFLRCVLSKASSNHLPERKHICTGCIYLAFLQFDLSNVSLNRLPNRKDIRTGCIYLAFLHCVFSNVCSKCLHKRIQSCTGCICLTFFPLWLVKCLLKAPAQQKGYSHWLHLFGFPPLCVFKCLFKVLPWEETKLQRMHLFDLLLCVFQMSSQIACLKEGICALFAFFGLSPLCVFKCLFTTIAWG